MLEDFDRRSFEQASDAERQVLCERLAAAISDRLGRADDFFRCVHEVIDVLRAAGHDLWSFDTDGETFEVWCSNWVRPTGPGIIVVFNAGGPAHVSWPSR